MKEKEIRDRITATLTSTLPCQEPVQVIMYGTSFPSGVYAYAAPMPGTWGTPPTDFIPYVPYVPPADFTPQPKRPSQVDKSELDELILGVLALKGQTVEIFNLKALVAAIKERVEKIL